MKANVLFAFIGGAVVGAATALLFSTETGAQTRQKIKETVDNEYRNLKEKYAGHQKKQAPENIQSPETEPQA